MAGSEALAQLLGSTPEASAGRSIYRLRAVKSRQQARHDRDAHRRRATLETGAAPFVYAVGTSAFVCAAKPRLILQTAQADSTISGLLLSRAAAVGVAAAPDRHAAAPSASAARGGTRKRIRSRPTSAPATG
jgi:hypothetical protein